MEKIIKSGILLSIFKRKGGEGIYTKIVFGNKQFRNILPFELDATEDLLISSDSSISYWFLITNHRLIVKSEGEFIFFELKDLQKWNFIFENPELGFEKIKLTFTDGKTYVLKVEEGRPSMGIIQVFSFLV